MFISLISIIWSIRILANISSYIHLWYVKEYRPDRMLIHLRRTSQGKWIYFPKWKLPPLSIKTAVLATILTGSEIALFLLLPYHIFVRFVIVDIALFPISFAYVVLLRIPTLMYHAHKIQSARTLLAGHTWKSVIGITGSFGKTSTKEFLSTIISSKYSVLKTELSKNSAIGISETVLSQLADQEMFVVEMGAYKLGEIAEMTNLVHPEIGIITSINAQHQDLFGSMETTMKAKYELLSGLSGKRIVIVNADNEYSHTMGQWAKAAGCDVWFVTKDKKSHPEATCWVEHSTSDQQSITFVFHFKKYSKSITVPIKGEHFVLNIALAIAASIASGMAFDEAVGGVETIQSVDRVMQLSKGRQGEILINDTFNNNPDAAIAAINYVNKFKKKKILVFQPMIELGAYTDSAHVAVGKTAGNICDEIILTNSNFSKAFIHGVHEVDAHKTVHIFSAEKAASYIRSIIHKDDAILFKGKEAEYVWKLLQ